MTCPRRGQGGVPPRQNGHREDPRGRASRPPGLKVKWVAQVHQPPSSPAHTWVPGMEEVCFWVSSTWSWAEMHCPLDGTPAICLGWTRRTEASDVWHASVLISPRAPCPQPRPGFLCLEILVRKPSALCMWPRWESTFRCRQDWGCSLCSGKYRWRFLWWVRPKPQVQVLVRGRH